MGWQQSRVAVTVDEFYKLVFVAKSSVIDFISEFELYRKLYIGGKMHLLVHIGLRGELTYLYLDMGSRLY